MCVFVCVCFVCWLELDSSIALCNVEQFLNPICYFYQYLGPQWDLFQDIQLAFGLSSCKTMLVDMEFMQLPIKNSNKHPFECRPLDS